MNWIAALLKDPDPLVRILALSMMEIPSADSPLLEVFLEALKDPQEEVRRAAAEIARHYTGYQAIADALGDLLKDPEISVQDAAIVSLSRADHIPCDVAGTLTAALEGRGRSAAAQQAAAEILVRLDPGIAPTLLRSPSRWVRLGTVEALQNSTAPEAVHALTVALEDRDGEIVSLAAMAIGDIPSLPEDIVRHLCRMAEDSPHLRWKIMQALGKHIGHSPTACNFLLEAAESAAWQVRMAAIAALEKAPEIPPAAFQKLHRALRDKSWRVRKAAVSVIRKGRPPQAASWLAQALLRERHEAVQYSLVAALAELGDWSEEVSTALLHVLRLPNADRAKIVAAEAVGNFGRASSEIVDALLGNMDSPNRGVRIAAARALANVVRQMPAPEQTIGAIVSALQKRDPGWDIVADLLPQVADLWPPAVGMMMEKLQSSPHIRSEMLRALGRFLHLPEVRSGIAAACLFSPSGRTRAEAAAILAGSSDPDTAAATLLSLLQWDPDRSVRAAAARGVAQLGPIYPQLMPVILGLLQDQDWLVQEAVLEAMQKWPSIPQEAGEALMQCLTLGPIPVRALAARAMGSCRPPGAEQAVRDILRTGKNAAWLIEAIACWGPDMVTSFVRDRNIPEEVRRCLVESWRKEK